MYQFSYAEVIEDRPEDSRAREHEALGQAVELLERASGTGVRSPEAAEALLFVRRLWDIFIKDLSHSENDLPEALRTNLIGVGRWILRETEKIWNDGSENFGGLIQMNAIIRDGLR